MISKRKHILVIDPAINEPATPCFNKLVFLYPNIHFTLHLPAIVGTKTFQNTPPFDAVFILGSASFVHEDLPWQQETFTFVKSSLEKNVPVLGICFGHQLVAKGFGAKIDFVTEDQEKLGGVRLVNFYSQTLTFAVNHRQEIKTLPDCFESLAGSEKITYEIIRHKTLPFIGVQAHPEASEFFMDEYIGNISAADKKNAEKDGADFINHFLKTYSLGER